MTVSESQLDLGRGPFSHDQIASTLSRRFQELIILPTEKCNFRCTYCYEDFAIGKMPEHVQQSIERFLDVRVPELASLRLSWFGGEPLVARNVVTRISSYASALCKRYDVVLDGGITTNGYLLDAGLFSQLLDYDQKFFQITLDGWEGSHDAVRPQANGRGTFERIWENLLATRQDPREFTILLRIHLRRDNLASVEELLANLAKAFGRDVRYQIDFQHLRDLGGQGGRSIKFPLSRREKEEISARLTEKYRAFLSECPPLVSSGDGEFEPLLAQEECDSIQQPHTSAPICYAAKPNSLLIRADGRVGKCTVALSDERNTIGKINPDGSLTIDNARLRPWIRGLWDMKQESLHCPWQNMDAASSEIPLPS